MFGLGVISLNLQTEKKLMDFLYLVDFKYIGLIQNLFIVYILLSKYELNHTPTQFIRSAYDNKGAIF